MAQWSINIDNFQRFASGWWTDDVIFGDKSHAREMAVVDLFQNQKLNQGLGIASMTNVASVTTLLKHILDYPPTLNVTYGIGGAKLYKMTEDTITADATWPHTIDKAAVTAEDGESVCHYKGALYYAYNHSGSAGDIGKYDLASTFDDDWGATVPTGAGTLQSAPHQIIVGGDDVMYIANGQYIATLSTTTLTLQALDFPTGSVVMSIAWSNNRLYCAVNKSNFGENNRNQSAIYVWDGISSSWDYEIPLNGRIGALYNKNGIIYIWWEELVNDAPIYKLGFINGSFIEEVLIYSSSTVTTNALPMFYQITSYKNHLLWMGYYNVDLSLTYDTTVDDARITVDSASATVDNYIAEDNIGLLAYGSMSVDLPTKIFQCLKSKYKTTIGAVANPFGLMMVASTDSSNYDLSYNYRYSLSSRWKTVYLQAGTGSQKGKIKKVFVYTDPILTGGALDATLKYDYDKSSMALTQIAYDAGVNTTKHKIFDGGLPVENFALDFSWENGSTVNPVNIRSIIIEGDFLTDN